MDEKNRTSKKTLIIAIVAVALGAVGPYSGKKIYNAVHTPNPIEVCRFKIDPNFAAKYGTDDWAQSCWNDIIIGRIVTEHGRRLLALEARDPNSK